MDDLIRRKDAILEIQAHGVGSFDFEEDDWWPAEAERYVISRLNKLPAVDAVEEENVLKFYYVESLDDYWIGRRVGNFYYAEYDSVAHHWVWTHSRYLPWGEHVVMPETAWKEHTYPSEPKKVPFEEWLKGFMKKYGQRREDGD